MPHAFGAECQAWWPKVREGGVFAGGSAVRCGGRFGGSSGFLWFRWFFLRPSGTKVLFLPRFSFCFLLLMILMDAECMMKKDVDLGLIDVD